ncbi:hypothetical protein ACEZ3G_05545 [Maribacter algicola]|uniref:Uncharacterized protein n=1 Tax=Meishania litoralis TaxID=3434685 RepID=A0ACC7LHD4_9FLAO
MRENKNNNTLVGAMAAIIIGLLIFAFMFRGPLDDGQEDRKEIAPPEQTIDLKLAAQLQQEYVRTRADSINAMLDKVDTRDFWFSLETMEQYIDYVKSEGEKKGYKDMGIRIFYAAYPQDSRDPRADPGYSTVVLVPTMGKPRIANGFFPVAPIQSTAGGIKALNFGSGGHPPNDVQ